MKTSNFSNITPSATLSLNDRINKMTADGNEITHFGFGGSPFPIPPFMINALQENAYKNEYLPVKGLVSLRNCLAEYYNTRDNTNHSRDNIIIGPGSKELLFLIQMSFTTSNVYIPTPTWVSYMTHAKIANHQISYITTTYENDWKITIADLQQMFQTPNKQHKILILNTPSNPTGTVYMPQQLQEFADYLKDKDITIIIDEIYENQVYSNNYTSLAKFLPQKCIITSGLSKCMAAGGWRLGWCIIPESLNIIRDKLTILASETYSTANTPVQYATLSLFNSEYLLQRDLYWKKSNCILKALTHYCVTALRQNNIKCIYPRASWYLFTDFTYYQKQFSKNNINNSLDLANKILTDINIAILPGIVHGMPENSYTARLCLVCFDGKLALSNCPENLDISQSWLKQYCSKTIFGIERLIKWLLNDINI